MAALKILVIPGSLRTGSINARLAAVAVKELALLDVDVTLISLADYPLPIYNGDFERDEGIPENATKLARLIAAQQGVFIATSEYNNSLPPLLKNSIDWVSRIRAGASGIPYRNRVYGIGSTSDGFIGGARALIDLRRVVLTAGKIGIYEAVDAATGEFLFAHDLGLQNIVTEIDARTGAKTIDRDRLPGNGGIQLVCPHGAGAKNFLPASFDARSGVLYVPLNEACMDVFPVPGGGAGALSSGVNWGIRPRPGSDGNFGRLQAIDLESGRPVWTARQRASSLRMRTPGVNPRSSRRRRAKPRNDGSSATISATVPAGRSVSGMTPARAAGGSLAAATTWTFAASIGARRNSFSPSLNTSRAGVRSMTRTTWPSRRPSAASCA